jgi:hypothetical protein
MKKCFPVHPSIHPSCFFTLALSIVSSKGGEFEISTFFEDLELGFGAHGAACLPACLSACLPASVFFACALLAASLLQTLIVFREGHRFACVCVAFLSPETFCCCFERQCCCCCRRVRPEFERFVNKFLSQTRIFLLLGRIGLL